MLMGQPKQLPNMRVLVGILSELIGPTKLPQLYGLVTFLEGVTLTEQPTITPLNDRLLLEWANGDRLYVLNHKEAIYRYGVAEGKLPISTIIELFNEPTATPYQTARVEIKD